MPEFHLSRIFLLLIHLQQLPTHLHVHSSAAHILCKRREPSAVRWEQGPKSSESLLFLQRRTFMSSGSITDFHPAESSQPLNLFLSLIHGKMQLLSRFPAAFPGYPMERYLADHFTVHSVCWLQGKETTMRSLGKMFFSFRFGLPSGNPGVWSTNMEQRFPSPSAETEIKLIFTHP